MGGKWCDGNRVPAEVSSGGAIFPKNERSGLDSRVWASGFWLLAPAQMQQGQSSM